MRDTGQPSRPKAGFPPKRALRPTLALWPPGPEIRASGSAGLGVAPGGANGGGAVARRGGVAPPDARMALECAAQLAGGGLDLESPMSWQLWRVPWQRGPEASNMKTNKCEHGNYSFALWNLLLALDEQQTNGCLFFPRAFFRSGSVHF